MNKLFILGNGFDLSHNLNTRYENFKDYFEKTDKYYYDIFSMIYGKYKNSLWSEFEETLGKLQYEDIEECCSQLLYNWTITKETPDEIFDLYNDDYTDEIETYISTIIDLRGRFKEWIKSTITDEVLLKYKFKENDTFLNFNYTMILEKNYYVSNDKILHIHGSIEDDSEIIVGHCNEDYERLIIDDYDEAIYDSRIRYVIEKFNQAMGVILKNVENIIEENIEFFNAQYDMIYVIGHSMSRVDIDYFKTIFSNNSDTKWIISYHTDNDKFNINNAIDTIGIKNYELVDSESIVELVNN